MRIIRCRNIILLYYYYHKYYNISYSVSKLLNRMVDGKENYMIIDIVQIVKKLNSKGIT